MGESAEDSTKRTLDICMVSGFTTQAPWYFARFERRHGHTNKNGTQWIPDGGDLDIILCDSKLIETFLVVTAVTMEMTARVREIFNSIDRRATLSVRGEIANPMNHLFTLITTTFSRGFCFIDFS